MAWVYHTSVYMKYRMYVFEPSGMLYDDLWYRMNKPEQNVRKDGFFWRGVV